jgi:GDP-fucose transporter C1
VHGKGSGAQARKVVLAVSFYFFTSLSLTFMNKCIVRQFPFPLFVTAFQLVIAWIMLWVFGWAGQHCKPLAFAPPAEFDPSVAAAVLPAPLNPRVTNKASETPRDAKA